MDDRLIPEELELEILSRLPVKSIFRFRSVCKRWNFLIGTSSFITRYNDFSKSRPSKLLYVGKHPITKPRVLSSLDPETAKIIEVIEFPPFIDDEWAFNDYHRGMFVDSQGIPLIDDGLESRGVDHHDLLDDFSDDGKGSKRDRGIQILGPVNGIYCIFHGFALQWGGSFAAGWGGSLILWNPATRSYKYIVPPISFPFSIKYENMYFEKTSHYSVRDPLHFHIGFGYDDSINDYKVVIICHWDMYYGYPPDERWHARVYNNATDSQSTICYLKFRSRGELAFPYVDSKPEFCNGYVNGACHWLCLIRNEESYRHASEYGVLAFDMTKETFKLMSGPSIPIPPDDFYVRRSVWVLRETIVMVVTPLKRENVDVWIMKEYGIEDSWSLLCSIAVGPLEEGFGVVGITNDERIFFSDNKGKLISCQFEEDDVVEHDEPLGYPYSGSLTILEYVETLAFVQPKDHPQ